MTAAEHPGAEKRELEDSSEHGPVFWVAFVIGGAAMVFGARGLLLHIADTHYRIRWLEWFVGADIIHDLIVAPIIIGVGWLVYRVVPLRYRPPVRWGLIGTGLTLLIGAALLRRTAKVPHGNPTVQPLNYSTAVLTVLLVVWVIALVWALAVWAAGRRGAAGVAEENETETGTVRQ